jgi:hypothetical protein
MPASIKLWNKELIKNVFNKVWINIIFSLSLLILLLFNFAMIGFNLS